MASSVQRVGVQRVGVQRVETRCYRDKTRRRRGFRDRDIYNAHLTLTSNTRAGGFCLCSHRFQSMACLVQRVGVQRVETRCYRDKTRLRGFRDRDIYIMHI